MRLATFCVGAQIEFDGGLFRLAVRTLRGGWQAVDCVTGVLVEWPIQEMEAAYAGGHLIIRESDPPPTARSRPAASISDLSDSQQATIRFRSALLDEVRLRSAGRELSKKQLAALTATVSIELGRTKPVSISTYYKWLNRWAAGGNLALADGRDASKTRRVPAAYIARQAMADAIVAAKQVGKAGAPPTVTMNRLEQEVAKRVAEENARRIAQGHSSDKLLTPSRSTLHRIWREFPASERMIAQNGRISAAHAFRGGPGVAPPEACLELVEFDETRLPCYLFDEFSGVPLGRAWLSWYVDVYSHAPVGFYVGFEPPGDLGMMSALRHACLPKAYIATEYPNIEGRYAPAGVPSTLTFDNGLPQWGHTAREIGLDLNITIQFAQPRTPWFKPRVEGMFRLLNETLLQEMPGFVLRRDVDRKDYDPTKEGCIGLRHFLYIFHVWLVDVYMQSPQGLLRRTPAELWEEGTSVWPPRLVPRAHDLDVLFGVKRKGRLDHRGVVFQGLRYHSPELHALRKLHGDRLDVEVKIDPSDLARVHVRVNRKSPWIRATASNSYVENLSLHRHQLNLRNAQEKFGDRSLTSLMQAETILRETIAAALPAAESIRTNQQMARALGIGTQYMVSALGHDGQLGELRGPLAGGRINPFMSPEVPATDTPPVRGSPRQRRVIPNFEADRSLGGGDER